MTDARHPPSDPGQPSPSTTGHPPSDPERLKRAAGEAAASEVTDGMALGLGTGSTVRYTIEAVARRLAEGDLRDIVGVATSRATTDLAARLGIRLVDLSDLARPDRLEAELLDLTIDGADEVTPELDLIKGLGAALLREKIVAAASRRLVIVVDEGKRVERLGTHAPLPVAVVPFAWQLQQAACRALGARAELRLDAAGAPLVTDDGLYILDCHFPTGIESPAALEQALRERPGVVATGLFLGMTHSVFVAGGSGVYRMDRSAV